MAVLHLFLENLHFINVSIPNLLRSILTHSLVAAYHRALAGGVVVDGPFKVVRAQAHFVLGELSIEGHTEHRARIIKRHGDHLFANTLAIGSVCKTVLADLAIPLHVVVQQVSVEMVGVASPVAGGVGPGIDAHLGAVAYMGLGRVPADLVHLAIIVIVTLLAQLLHGQAVRSVGPLHLVAAGEADVALLVGVASSASCFAAANAQVAIPHVALGVGHALAAG